MTDEIKYVFICLFAIFMSYFVKCLFKSFAIYFFLLGCLHHWSVEMFIHSDAYLLPDLLKILSFILWLVFLFPLSFDEQKILSFNALQWKLFSLVINVIFLFPFVLSFQFRETLHTLRSRNYSMFFPIDFKIVVLSKLNVESIWNRFYVWCNVGSKFVYINIWLTHLLTKHYYFPTALQFYICHKSSN